jgi:M6 family metalloprotease-like protein
MKIAKRALSTSLVILVIVCGLALTASAQTLEDFGYNRMKVNGKEARGPRSLLVILAQFEGYPALAHGPEYYEKMIFTGLTAPNGQSVSLNGYYQVISQGRFYWHPANLYQTVLGPINLTLPPHGSEHSIEGHYARTRAVKDAARELFDFAQFDENADGQVTTDELSVLVIHNVASSPGWNYGDPDCSELFTSPDLCMRIAEVYDRANLMLMAHELLHSLGVIDLYRTGHENEGYTPMGGNPLPAEHLGAFHLDPFHKMQLGWIEPRIHSILEPGNATLTAQQMIIHDAPIILYNPNVGTNEYYILEYRTSTSPNGDGYDQNIPSNGMALWHVQTNDNKEPIATADFPYGAVCIEGPPNLSRGQGPLWGSGEAVPPGNNSFL